MEKKIKGVSHPIPMKYAERIYKKGKTVFVSKSHLGRVSNGDKFVIYESYGSKAYTGWANIINVVKMKSVDILKEYKNELMLTPEEFKEYSKGRTEMNVIKFKDFEQFKNPVIPKRFVGLSGKYIYENEFKTIQRDRG